MSTDTVQQLCHSSKFTITEIGALYRYPWYTRVTSTNFVPQTSTMVLNLCTKVQKFEFLTKTQRLALSCGHLTRGPVHRDGCPAHRLYITLVNGVMRGGLCVRRLARPNCHTLTLSFLQLDGVRTSPTPAPSRPHCILHAKFL